MSIYNNIKKVLQPHNMKVNLYPHQLASIYKMEQLEIYNKIEKENCVKYTKIGINADPTGYGKTLSMIGLILRDKMEWDLETPYIFERTIYEGKDRIKSLYNKKYDKLPTTLILVSQSIIGQWCKEIDKTDLTYKCIHCNKDLENLNVEDFNILLVTPPYYNKIVLMYSNYAWKRFIFDEPGHLKIASMRDIHAGFSWFVTATPMSIKNQYRFCKSSFMRDMFCNNIYDYESFINDLVVKNDPEYVKESFKMPSVNYYYHKCFQPLFNLVCNVVNYSIRSMIEAGNIEGAIESLGGEKTSNIIELIKNKRQEELIEINSKIEIYTLRNDSEKINEWTQKKVKIENQLTEIDKKFEEMLNNNCFICYDTLEYPVLEPNCQNLFCTKCLIKWLQQNNTCPLCRTDINMSSLIYITDNESVKDTVEHKMTKVEKVIDIILKNPEGKFLIFSEYDNTFYPMCEALSRHNLLYVQVKGNIKTRERNLEMFKTGNVPVIFLNSNYNGSGINLTEATDIILCHKMNENTEQQILGRALRIGRTELLNVHYLEILQ